MTLWLPLFILVLTFSSCSAIPRSFTPVDPISPDRVSHEIWNHLVQAWVRDGLVDYPSIQADGEIDRYLAELNRIDPTKFPSREGRMAFWINAYNAFAVKGIIDGYSPATLWGRYRYFIGREYRVGGTTVNLYDLERQVLIEQFREPLVHFAIVCASTSCPKLQSWAYQPDQLDRQLDTAAKAFINDPARNRFDRRQKLASLSMIFKWFESDFAHAAGSVLAYIARHVEDRELAEELKQPGYRVEYLEYDWSLNGTPPRKGNDARSS